MESERKERINLFKELHATKNKMKLFSFVEKYNDKDNVEKLKIKYDENNKVINFKAKKVPDFIREQIYTKILEDKNSLRIDRIQKRKEYFSKISRYPSNMKKHENNNSKYLNMTYDNDEYNFKPSINKNMPDFDRL